MVDGSITDSVGEGLYALGTTLLLRATVAGNSGTGVRVSPGALELHDSFLEGNGGHGLYASNASIDVSGTSIADNADSGVGASNSEVRLVDCSILRNQTGVGLYRTTATIERCAISENSRDGLAQSGGTVRVRSSTFFSNSPEGIDYSASPHEPSSLFVTNGTIVGNSRGLWMRYGRVTLHNTIIWGNAANIYLHGTYYRTYHGYGPSGDPLFVSHATGDLRLSPGSPCIDSGRTAGHLADQDGNLRAWDDPATPNTGSGTEDYTDRGAFEFGSPQACPADCDGDGECDADEIAGGEPDLNGDGVPDACQGTAGAVVGAGQSVTLLPDGGAGNRTLEPVIEFENLSGGPGSVTVVQSELELEPGAAGYSAFGRTLTIETDLADGEFLLRVSVPFTASDLSGASVLSPDLLYYDPPVFSWVLAASANTEPSPGHPGPIGDRFALQGTIPPVLSGDLGDHGVFWQTNVARGFVWANVDHTTDYRGGLVFDVLLDCNQNGIADELDIVSGFSLDCDGDGLPDECALAYSWDGDCDGDGLLDSCEIAQGLEVDCNGNGVPDSCDLASGTSKDLVPLGGDGVPDECQVGGKLVETPEPR